MMNFSQFTKAVAEMRTAQKLYFKSRMRSDLIKAKELEKQVDQALKEGIVKDEPAEQGRLLFRNGSRR